MDYGLADGVEGLVVGSIIGSGVGLAVDGKDACEEFKADKAGFGSGEVF